MYGTALTPAAAVPNVTLFGANANGIATFM